MGRSKDITAKEIMPSITRRGMNLPSRPYFSPAAASAIMNKAAALHSSPLSKISMPNDNEMNCQMVVWMMKSQTIHLTHDLIKILSWMKKLLRLMLLKHFRLKLSLPLVEILWKVV
jgi:hypothetical protein